MRIDGDVADVINNSKDDFYDKYEYLKPECEKSWLKKLKSGLIQLVNGVKIYEIKF